MELNEEQWEETTIGRKKTFRIRRVYDSAIRNGANGV